MTHVIFAVLAGLWLHALLHRLGHPCNRPTYWALYGSALLLGFAIWGFY